MGDALSWGWDLVAGALTPLFLWEAWLSALGVVFAMIGTARRRCGWWDAVAYLAMYAVFAALFRSVGWVSGRVSRPWGPGPALFWVGFAACGVWCLRGARGRFGEMWRSTNWPRGLLAVRPCSAR